MTRASLVLIILVLVAIGGCADASVPATVPDAQGPSTFEAGADPNVAGTISVLVMDESLLPISGATVGLRGLDAVLTTTEVGRVEFHGLQPGDYVVEVQALGFQPVARRTTVGAGALVEESITLKQVALDVPFHRLSVFRGMISCGASLVVTALSLNCTGNERMRFDFPVDGNLRSMVDEAVWTKNNALGADRLRLWLAQNDTTVATISFECSYVVAHGSSPIALAFHGSFGCNTAEGGLMTSWLRTPLEVGALAVIVEQPFMMYVTEFYGEPAPDGYAARPDT